MLVGRFGHERERMDRPAHRVAERRVDEPVAIDGAFAGEGPVDRHRLVYAALGEAIIGSAAPIHALALTTFTPDEQGART